MPFAQLAANAAIKTRRKWKLLGIWYEHVLWAPSHTQPTRLAKVFVNLDFEDAPSDDTHRLVST